MSMLSREEIYQVVDQYRQSENREPVIIFGAGYIGHKAATYCGEKGIPVS